MRHIITIVFLMITGLVWAASTNENQIVTRHLNDSRLFTNNTAVGTVAGLDPVSSNDFVTLQFMTNGVTTNTTTKYLGDCTPLDIMVIKK